MKQIFLLIALCFAKTSIAQSPWYFGTGEAVNLTNGTAYKNGIKNISGALNPSSTAVNAPAGSLYFSTSGTLYVKQDAGLTTNWLPLASAPVGTLATINGQGGPAVVLAAGTTGTDFSISAAANTVTFDIPSASGSNRGLLTSANWTTFNNKEPAITATTSADYYRGDKTFATLNKTAVGLANADNTSDANKPVSTATQTALDLKQGLLVNSAGLRGALSDETGTGLAVFGTSPNITTPTGIVANDVGLGLVDNTSDATKNAATVSLTNKTINADFNTITNIENADIKAAAAIDATKIADGTVTSSEFQFINTLSSNAQTQLDAKQATITGSATTIDTETLTASRAMATDASGKVGLALPSLTEINFVDGVTSAIQTQLDAKQATITGSATTIDTETLTASRTVVTDVSGKIAAGTVTFDELDTLAGITTGTSIQSRLVGKVDGPVSSVDNTVATFDSTTGKIIQGNATVTLSDTELLEGLAGVTTSSLTVASTETSDAATTGASAIIPLVTTSSHYILTNASLTSIGSFSSTANGMVAIVENQTGRDIQILDEDTDTATANERFLTGTGVDLTLKDGAAVVTKYNNLSDRWQVIGSGAGTQNLDQSRLAGESYFAGTAACTWSRTSTTIGAFTADTDCPGPTVTYGNMGTWATTDSNLPIQTITGLPAGTYKAKFLFESNQGASNSNAWAINDGTTTCYATGGGSSSVEANLGIVECSFKYTSSGTRTFQLYTASSSSASNVYGNRVTPPTGTKFILEYFVNESVYSSTCGAECVDTFVAHVSGAGVVTGENIDWINGNAALSGTSSNRKAITFNGGIFTVAPICTIAVVGCTTEAGSCNNTSNITSLTSSALSMSGANNPDTAWRANDIFFSCTKSGADFTASRTIVGSFDEVPTVSGTTKPLVFGAVVTSVCSSSPCTISQNYGQKISSITRSSTGVYNTILTYVSGVPVCSLTSQNTTAGNAAITCHRHGTPTSTDYGFSCKQGTAFVDYNFEIYCLSSGQ